MDRIAITIPEAAKMLGISHVTMWRWVTSGKVPSVKFGNAHRDTRRILVKDFEEFLERHKED